jgi:hypothetical protein
MDYETRYNEAEAEAEAEAETETEGLSADEQLRLEALKLAVEQGQPSVEGEDEVLPEPASITIERAKEFEKYIRGTE